MKAATLRRSDQAAAGVPPAAVVSWAGAVATVTVTGELGSARAAQLARELARVAASRPHKLVLDLHGAVLVNLPGARLMTTVREAVARRCALVLCTSPHPADPYAATAMPGQVSMNRARRPARLPGGHFWVHLAWGQAQVLLAVGGELDLTTVHHVQDALSEITVRPGRVVHLDLSRLAFADVAGARALCLAVTQLRQMGRQVTVSRMQPRVRRVLDCLGAALTASPSRNTGALPQTLALAREMGGAGPVMSSPVQASRGPEPPGAARALYARPAGIPTPPSKNPG